MDGLVNRLGLVEDTFVLGGRAVSLLRPGDSEALLDEAAFEREEFLPYWAEVWPSGLVLARHVGGLALRGATVLELGCGLALPSIAAAVRGARVLATDWSPDAIELARRNAARNELDLELALASWADPAPLVARAPWDVVLAADVLYERRNGELLIELLPRLVGEEGEVLLADPGRPHARTFFAEAAELWAVQPVAPPVGSVRVVRLRKRSEPSR